MNNIRGDEAPAKKSNVWGVLGGMGPHASAEFISTIYDTCKGTSEQEMPIVYLFSDPTVPDRTASLLDQEDELLLDRLEHGIGALLLAGATRVIVCCMTLHCVVDRLPSSHRRRIISLLDVLFDALLIMRRRRLMMCSSGARLKGLYEAHVCWQRASDIIIMPDDQDQRAIHKLIYDIKRDRGQAFCDEFIEYLGQKYNTREFIAGCTELHLVARRHKTQNASPVWKPSWVDPLEKIADLIAVNARQSTMPNQYRER